MASSFRDLNIWKKGHELVMRIYKVSSKFPIDEKHGLTNQIRKSANSVVANIAESHGRYHFADKCRVLYQARGECTETQSHLSVANSLGYVTREEFGSLDKEYEGLGVGINAYISTMKHDA